VTTHGGAPPAPPAAPPRAAEGRAPIGDLERLRSQVAALEQLLEVHERTSLEQATRLERTLGERETLLARERGARERLSESDQRLRVALDAGRMGTWEWDIAAGRVLWSNEEEALYGLEPGSFSGTMEEYRERIHPEDRASSLALVQEALAARAPDHHVLHRILRPDGAVRWLESHARFLYDEAGRPLRLVGVSTDVTEQQEAEQALREREEEFRTLANSIPQLAWMTDAEGAINWYNQRWYDYTGTTFEQMRGWGWQSVHHPDHVDRVREKFVRAVAAGEAWEDTFPLRGADGRYRWFLSRALPIRDAAGRVTRWFGTNTDVTERLEIEAARDRALAEASTERQRLSEVFRQAPAAITVLEGPEHRFTVVNALYAELVGGRDVEGRTVREALPELAGQGFYELLDDVYSTGEGVTANERLVQLDRDGDGVLEELFVDFVYQPMKDAAGRTFGIMVHAVETTERVLTRRRVEALAAERAAILGQIADGVVMTGVDGRISFINDAARAIYGDMRTGVAMWDPSQPFEILYPDGAVKPADDVVLRRALRGERVLGEEWRVRRADGREVAVLGSAVPVLGADAAPLGAVMTARDVTERLRLQRQLEHERLRLQESLMQAPAAITVTEGPEHMTVMQNEAARQLLGGRDIVGRRSREVFPEIESQGFIALQDEVYRTGEPFVGREMLVRFDRRGTGEPEDGYFNFVYQPLRDAEGSVYGILTHAVEVTEQVRARQQIEEKAEQLARLTRELEQSNRELDQFAYVASHDLKAPLRGIANLTQWIEEDLGDRVMGESKEHMALLKGRVNRMEALIDGILDYSRAGRVRAEAEQVDVGELVGEVVELLAPPPEVEVVVAPNMPSILTERVPLQQVFMNLVGNAIKYNRRPGGRVDVSAAPEGEERWRFAVADNGPGIAPQYHERIWQIFQTLNARDKVEGTGIGLSVVRKLVESRGGRVWLESDVGCGATFNFTWPAPRGRRRDGSAE
jgi:PAS domain S-box-containing protein